MLLSWAVAFSNIKPIYELIHNHLCGQVFNDTIQTKVVAASFGDAAEARGCLFMAKILDFSVERIGAKLKSLICQDLSI